MACFIAPLIQAVATTAVRKSSQSSAQGAESRPLLRHLPTLEKMLWGGTVMLVVDHVLNGELTWRFPFFSALASEGGGWVTMLREILQVGVPMCVVLTLVWAGYILLKEGGIRKESSTSSKTVQ